MRTSYQAELERLHVDLMKMGALIEQAITKCITAYRNLDFALAKQISKDDREVNDMEKAIESRALSLMLKQQPVAGDLRNISSALKVVTDMERIGDQAADIADLVLRFKGPSATGPHDSIFQMAEVAKAMVNRAVRAYIESDIELAEQTIAQDDEMDELFNRAKEAIIAGLKSGAGSADEFVDMLMICKYFERIGDHSVNICEWAEFDKTGSIHHENLI